MKFYTSKKTYFPLVAMLVLLQKNYAQKQTVHVNQLWFAYFNQTRFSEKWGLWADFQLRTKEDFVEDLSTGIARIGLTYYLNDDAKLTVGYAYVNHFPADNHADISRPENRLWQQIQWHTKYPRIRLMQYARLEERFRRKVKDNDELEEGYNFNYRFRYNFLFLTPIGKKSFAAKTFSFVVNDEFMVNFGEEIVYNYFDQNRFFIGFNYHTNSSGNLQFGYLNVFAQLPNGNTYRSINGVRVAYFHSLDLRKKMGK
jgi:Protein of unknown function (DUF2490)